MRTHPTVILQGHLDMVCEKDADCDIDFSKDGLRLRHDDTYIFADGTTLGGDDGIAVAYALAVLDSSELKHRRSRRCLPSTRRSACSARQPLI